MEVGRPRERRIVDRHPVDLRVTLRGYRQPAIAAHITDLSEGGAMLAVPGDAFPRGEELFLVALGIELVVTIAWATDGYRGLTFHRRLTMQEITALRHAGRPRIRETDAPLPPDPAST